ncbi:MAG: bifunctional diaminohydroxyphosphoribosylaminopyrimidine deaminase/5-amino-6-(5-phosphoribosylamino)uracil reductase RibD [Bacteroidales bacterium]
MKLHENYMLRCFDLAKTALGKVSPNPMVGCVIVHNDRIIGEGFHQYFGGPHAEVNAIQSVRDKNLLKESCLYVNLEPCNHFGKTPPCTELIIESRIPQVVISNTDPFPQVNGSGINRLQQAGINVISGISEEQGFELNRRFFTFHTHHRPYIILKWAQTLDGYMDIDRSDPTVPFRWISNDSLKMLVHKWRTEEAGILVGYTTALNDNPRLNVREWAGKDPLRMVLDEHLTLPGSLHLFDGESPTLVFTAKEKSPKKNLEYITLDFSSNIIFQIHQHLYHKGIQSLIVEGGRELLDTYLEYSCWDEARVLEGNQFFGRGLKGPDFKGQLQSTVMIDLDRLLLFTNPQRYPQGTLHL